VREGRARHIKRAVEINLNNLFPIVGIELFDADSQTRDAGIVHQLLDLFLFGLDTSQTFVGVALGVPAARDGLR
jgi:hypothetical protein